MIPMSTLVHNVDSLDRFLAYNDEVEHPIVLQIGGSDPEAAKMSCQLAKSYNYDQINLNVGCPSERVAGKGAFGAALMLQPDLVANICLAMKDSVDSCYSVSVKCRIGVDDCDSYQSLANFVRIVSEKGEVQNFIIHARKAILKGLSPDQNRKIPPLKVYINAEKFCEQNDSFSTSMFIN